MFVRTLWADSFYGHGHSSVDYVGMHGPFITSAQHAGRVPRTVIMCLSLLGLIVRPHAAAKQTPERGTARPSRVAAPALGVGIGATLAIVRCLPAATSVLDLHRSTAPDPIGASF
jgi:hypothetical protein